MPSITIQSNELLTVPVVAKRLRRPKMTIYRWLNNGKINSIKLGGILFIPITELTCLSCLHHTDNLCACREPNDMISTPGKCPDWHHKK